MNAREVLNSLKWRDRADPKDIEIWYIHRSAASNTRIVRGDSVVNIGRYYLVLEGSEIPYHRVIRITFKGDVVYDRYREKSG